MSKAYYLHAETLVRGCHGSYSPGDPRVRTQILPAQGWQDTVCKVSWEQLILVAHKYNIFDRVRFYE